MRTDACCIRSASRSADDLTIRGRSPTRTSPKSQKWLQHRRLRAHRPRQSVRDWPSMPTRASTAIILCAIISRACNGTAKARLDTWLTNLSRCSSERLQPSGRRDVSCRDGRAHLRARLQGGPHAGARGAARRRSSRPLAPSWPAIGTTWSKVLWSSLRTITRHSPPRPLPGPSTRGSSTVWLTLSG